MNTSTADIIGLATERAILDGLATIQDFVGQEEFQAILREMWMLPDALRHEFVELIWLDDKELARRGLKIPSHLTIQRSWFEDRRPTLFCVSSHLPQGIGWKKVTITFDNEMTPGAAPAWSPVGDP